MGNVQPLEVVGRGSKTQLQMAENLNVSFIVQDTKGLSDTHPTLHERSLCQHKHTDYSHNMLFHIRDDIYWCLITYLLTVCMFIMTIIVFNPFYYSIKSQLLGMD